MRRLRLTIELLGRRPRLGATVAGWLFAEWFRELGYSRQQTADLVRGRMSRTPPLALVARAGGEAVGTVSLVPGDHPLRPGTVQCLAGLYVVPEWRGRGVGARLCRRAVREAWRLGTTTLHLYTADAERFYQRLGWHKIVDAVIEGSRGLELAAFLGIDTTPLTSRNPRAETRDADTLGIRRRGSNPGPGAVTIPVAWRRASGRGPPAPGAGAAATATPVPAPSAYHHIEVDLTAKIPCQENTMHPPQHRPRAGQQRRGPLVVEELESRLVPAAVLPRPDHVVVVIEENHSFSQIIGSADAPYINSLAQQGALMTASTGVEHPSQPNYLDLFSGSNQGTTGTDARPSNPPPPFTTPNLGAELRAAALSFVGYSESLPSAGFDGDSFTTVAGQNQYQRKHNPWANWVNDPVGANQLPASVNQPFTSFPTDFSQLPTVAIVVPNEQNDMHDGTVAQGDTWLKNNLDGYVQWARSHNSLLVVTWDENDFSPGNQIPTILVGPMVQPGSYGQAINHFNVLRTVEDMYGLPAAGASATATPIASIWQFSSSPGVFDPGTGTWYLRSSNSAGAPDAGQFAYGAPGWVPVVGDWDGNGTTTVGVFDPATATWYLRNHNSAGAPDYTPFQYGAPGWLPVVGDWTGSGHTGVGVVDPTTGTWYLRTEVGPGAPDAGQFQYGAPGWKPVTGDWTGSGKTGIGVVDPTTNTWYLRNENSAGGPDAGPFAYGAPGWLPVIGDFKVSENL